MSGNVRGVCEGGTDLLRAERVLYRDGIGGFAGRESSNNRRNIDARAGETWLPEPHVGIH